jgi:hypothetical protein
VVTVVGTIPGQNTFFGPTGDQTVSGSGVFISQEGYILTNNHVVEGTKEVSSPSDGRRRKYHRRHRPVFRPGSRRMALRRATLGNLDVPTRRNRYHIGLLLGFHNTVRSASASAGSTLGRATD